MVDARQNSHCCLQLDEPIVTAMTPLIVALVVILTLAALLRLVHRRGVARFRLEQFRPAAPLAGVLPGDRDAQRQYSDLRAMYDHAGR